MEDEVNKPKFEAMGIKFPEELKGLIDEPPLLEGEDPKLYWSLLAAVIDEEKPQGIMDCIDAIDQVSVGRAAPQAGVRRAYSRRNAYGVEVFLGAYNGDTKDSRSGPQLFQQGPERKAACHIALGSAWNYAGGAPSQGRATE
jgi:hypothetical protein